MCPVAACRIRAARLAAGRVHRIQLVEKILETVRQSFFDNRIVKLLQSVGPFGRAARGAVVAAPVIASAIAGALSVI